MTEVKNLRELLKLAEEYLEDPLEVELVNSKDDRIYLFRQDVHSVIEVVGYDQGNKQDHKTNLEALVTWNHDWQDDVCKSFGLDPEDTDWGFSPDVFMQLESIQQWAGDVAEAFKPYRKEWNHDNT